jgi:hypothetical protein
MPIYLAMAQAYGLGQGDVDEMELWVIAGLLNPEGDTDPNDVFDRMLTPEEFEAEARRLLRERVAAAGREAASSIPSDAAPEEVT